MFEVYIQNSKGHIYTVKADPLGKMGFYQRVIDNATYEKLRTKINKLE